VNALRAPEPGFPTQAWALQRGESMLWAIIVVLVVLWLLGFSFHVGGALIHLLLVVALIILVINLISGRRSIL
jgi:hypothetical protein